MDFRTFQQNARYHVTPAQAGVQDRSVHGWIPAFAGMTCGRPCHIHIVLEILRKEQNHAKHVQQRERRN
jgi:hypothetical protein